MLPRSINLRRCELERCSISEGMSLPLLGGVDSRSAALKRVAERVWRFQPPQAWQASAQSKMTVWSQEKKSIYVRFQTDNFKDRAKLPELS